MLAQYRNASISMPELRRAMPIVTPEVRRAMPVPTPLKPNTPEQREVEERQAQEQADIGIDAQDVRRNVNNPYIGNETEALTRQGLKIKDRALQIQAEKDWLMQHGF
jgi:hypothetical protein